MNQEQVPPHDNRDLVLLVLLLALGIAGFQLGMAATGHDISREQHLATAVEYARGHIDLLQPVIVGFNANGTPTPLEFPIWQAITALLMKAFGVWYGWGNLVALFSLFTSMWPLFDLARRLFSERVAWWTLFFSLSQPLNIIFGGRAGADSTAWALAVWFIYFAYRMFAGGGWAWWPAAVVAGCLSATTKAPFFMAAGLTTFFWLLKDHRRSFAAWVQLSSAGLVSCLAFCAWNMHANQLYADAEFPLMDLRAFQGGGLAGFCVGDLAYRLNPLNWARAGWHALSYLFGNIGFIFLLLAGMRLPRTTALWLWLLATAGATAVFTRLIFMQWHYFLIFSPVMALFCACAAQRFESAIWQGLRAGVLLRMAILLAAMVLPLAETSQAIYFNQFFDRYWADAGRLIRQNSAATDKLIVSGGTTATDWSEPFFAAERNGFTIKELGWLNDPAKLARLKELGYTRLVLLNTSPFFVALGTVTGMRAEHTVDLPRQLPAIATNWPVLLQSPLVLIVEIPR